jgi:hypothetical protein
MEPYMCGYALPLSALDAILIAVSILLNFDIFDTATLY